MIIDVIDMEDPHLGQDRLAQLKSANSNSTIMVMYGMSNGVAQMISDIARRCRPGDLDILASGRMAGRADKASRAAMEEKSIEWHTGPECPSVISTTCSRS